MRGSGAGLRRQEGTTEAHGGDGHARADDQKDGDEAELPEGVSPAYDGLVVEV